MSSVVFKNDTTIKRAREGYRLSPVCAFMTRQASSRQRGQVAIEYLLLLIVGVVLWLMIVNGLVSRNPESPGVVTQKWGQIINFISTDKIDN